MKRNSNESYVSPEIEFEVFDTERGAFLSGGDKDTNPNPTENPDLGDGKDTDW